jgi:hypothetical protein
MVNTKQTPEQYQYSRLGKKPLSLYSRSIGVGRTTVTEALSAVRRNRTV